jgi:hypothetical protein
MKNFLQHLTESQKTYEFRIKIADIDPADQLDRLKNALEAYGLESLSAIKRIPIKANDIDFPSIENCQIYLMDAVLKYPCNDAQVRAIIVDRGNFPASNVVVVPTGHPEEAWRWNLEGNELREYVQGEAVLDKPYEDNPEGKAAGKTYSEVGSLLKELSTAKVDIAGNDPVDNKTTNELPQGDVSPVGSKQNKITNPVKGN